MVAASRWEVAVNLAERFAEDSVTSLDLERYVRMTSDALVRDVVTALNDSGHTCACVTEGERPIGIVTDRDILTRVVGYPMTWDMPIDAVMTPEPETVAAGASVGDALEMMAVFRFRNVPVVDDRGALAGNLDRYALLQYADAQLFSRESVETHELAAQHGLLFVDFTGLDLATPVTVSADTDLKHVVHTMRGRGIGSVLVTSDGGLAGIFTDHDAQMKVACRIENLATVSVADAMTAAPATLRARQPIADGLRLMAKKRLSHIPLVDPVSQPVAIVSFRDLADYLQTALLSMG
jgi:CBS domain-containing protein